MSENTFRTLGVPSRLCSVLSADGKTEPFPIQSDTLPDTLAGRDVLGRAKTGSGKTLAFTIPLAARLGGAAGRRRRRPGRPVGLILAPTRELVTQISAALTPFAKAYDLTTTTVFGGVSQKPQEAALRAGVDIVVACPGRLEDLMGQGLITLDAVEITVLDEADHMADLGFLPVITRILDTTPTTGQRMLFSATLDGGVDVLVRRYLHDPVTHSVDDVNSHVERLTHHVFEVETPESKNALIRTLASGTGRRILFTRTKHQARKLATKLTSGGIPSVDLHGNLSQAARDRNLAAFDAGRARVLVATDVAARGVHVADVELVVHIDPPAEHKAYLHRSGRTARAGNAGDVVTIVLPSQRRDIVALLRKAQIRVTPQAVDASSPLVMDLVGDRAAYVAPRAKQPDRKQADRPRRRPQSAGDRSRRGGRSGSDRSREEATGKPRARSGGARRGNTRSRTPGRSSGTGHLRVGSRVGEARGSGRGRAPRRARG